MGIQVLIGAYLLLGSLTPMGYVYRQYPNQDSIWVFMKCGTDTDERFTNVRGRYVGHLDNSYVESQVDFEFTKDDRKAFLIDTIGSAGPGNNIAPDVFLYDTAEGRYVTASVYMLHDSTGFNIDPALFSAELFNLTGSDSADGCVYPETAFSDVFAHVRADAGDSLLLRVSAPSGDTARFVSYRTFYHQNQIWLTAKTSLGRP